jgi:UrcA family protein
MRCSRVTRPPPAAMTTGLAAIAQLASAASPIDDSRRHVEVQFADLNLSTTAGADMLYQRLHSAAESVCNEDGTKDLGSMFRVKACMSAAISAAVTQRQAVNLRRRARRSSRWYVLHGSRLAETRQVFLSLRERRRYVYSRR